MEQAETLPFADQIELARQMIETSTKRNEFARIHGGGDFDGFASVGQYVGDNRALYDALEKKFDEVAVRFDAAVPDRKAFVKKLRSAGQGQLADEFAERFGLQEGFLTRLLRK